MSHLAAYMKAIKDERYTGIHKRMLRAAALRDRGITSASEPQAIYDAWMRRGGEPLTTNRWLMRAWLMKYERDYGLSGIAAEPTLVFVYGSLKRGGRLNSILALNGARLIGEATVYGYTLYGVGYDPQCMGYPVMVPSDILDYVTGEVYALKPGRTIDVLDEVELGAGYQRRSVQASVVITNEQENTVRDLDVQVYVDEQNILPRAAKVGATWSNRAAR